MSIIFKCSIMLGLIIYLAMVGIGTGVQVNEAIQNRKSRKNCKQIPTDSSKTNYRKSETSSESESSGYTPILDCPDFYTSFGGY